MTKFMSKRSIKGYRKRGAIKLEQNDEKGIWEGGRWGEYN